MAEVGHVFDQDALTASMDLARRAGASSFEIGYLHDDVPVEEAGWYATAFYEGSRVISENARGPVEAAEALARRLFTGALCRRCGKPIRLNDDEVVIAAQSGSDHPSCRWWRNGPKWEPGCGKPIDLSIPAPR